MSNSIEEWLKRLEELEPADGKLTTEIVSMAGDVPLNVNQNRIFEVARVKAYVETFLQARTNSFDVRAHDAATAGNSDEAAKLNARSGYWKSVAALVRRLE